MGAEAQAAVPLARREPLPAVAATPPAAASGAGTAAMPASPGTGSPVAPQAQAGERPESGEAMVRAEALSLVRTWLVAWEAKNLKGYLDCYAEGFRSGAMDLAAWAEHKRRVFAGAGNIEVELSDIEVQVTGEGAAVRFLQDYRSAGHSDRGHKLLVLQPTGAGLRIASEDWSPL
jgi:hypothetical protein